MTDPSRARRLATLADVLHRREPGTRYEVHYAVAEELLAALEREELAATAGPRVWAMPDPPPSDDVTAVRDRHKRVFRRTDGHYWRRDEPGSYEWPFPDLLAHCGPLTEVPDEGGDTA